ncbi:hypothetical protein JG687_00018604 [Phytophthora cactorum]|uniref:Uncharacterized protein n=1 Tax=Phytophthora cactorum TaxID=29920 RepID=A0A8T1TP35_9STRA|nr:hypothetical protein JG687_00018604 [Phytophthora cactorum]
MARSFGDGNHAPRAQCQIVHDCRLALLGRSGGSVDLPSRTFLQWRSCVHSRLPPGAVADRHRSTNHRFSLIQDHRRLIRHLRCQSTRLGEYSLAAYWVRGRSGWQPSLAPRLRQTSPAVHVEYPRGVGRDGLVVPPVASLATVRPVLLRPAFASVSSVAATVAVPFVPELLSSASGDESLFPLEQAHQDILKLADVVQTQPTKILHEPIVAAS